jgi:hypothetical protein
MLQQCFRRPITSTINGTGTSGDVHSVVRNWVELISDHVDF